MTISEKSIHHIVLFELTDAATDNDIQAMIADGKELLRQIPGVLAVEIGLKARDDREVHLKNYQVALYVHLRSNADLDIYSPHPNHQEFLARHKAKWINVQVADFFGD